MLNAEDKDRAILEIYGEDNSKLLYRAVFFQYPEIDCVNISVMEGERSGMLTISGLNAICELRDFLNEVCDRAGFDDE